MPHSDLLIELFNQAKAHSVGADQEQFLAQACPGDPALIAEVLSLLQASECTGDFLKNKCPPPTVQVTEKCGDVIGRYKLGETLGEGGCGVVYVADQEDPVRRRVALKVIKLGMDTRAVVARFEAERQALALMDHPNIAKVFDAGATVTGRPYFVMELVHGVRITDYCDQSSFSIKERLDLFIQVCHAIQHAHQKGVIHRDIKPSNIVVTPHDGVAVPKVIDFGIAKATEGRLTEATVYSHLHLFIGTPAYMSPEQAEMSRLDIDTRSDIYSLGVLLYELLVGSTPFDAQALLASGIDAMRRTIREKEPVQPSTRLSTMRQVELTAAARHRHSEPAKLIALVRGDLDWIVMKCLEKDRTHRYETANGVAMDLKRFLNSEIVVARPPTATYRVRKFVRRHKTVVTGSVLAAILLIAGIVGTSLGLIQAKREGVKAVESLYLQRIGLAHSELMRDPPDIQQAENLLAASRREPSDWEWRYLKRQWLTDPLVLRDPANVPINSVAFSSDDRFLASAGADGMITIWDLATRQPTRVLPAHTNGFAFCVAFHPLDPEVLVTAGSDKQIKLWNWTKPEVILSWSCEFSFYWGMAYAVAFSPDGQRLAAPTKEGIVMIWDATTGADLLRVPGQHGTVFSLAFSPDGRRLATGSRDGIRILDAGNGQLLRELGGKGEPISCVAFSNDGQRLAAAGFDYFVTVWDMESGNPILPPIPAHTKQAVGVIFSADDRRLATAGFDGTVKLWDASTGREVLTFRDFKKKAQCVTISHDGHRLAACSMDGTIRLWDATPLVGSEGNGLLTLQQPADMIRTLDLRGDGVWLASGGRNVPKQPSGTAPIYLWETRTGRLLNTLVGHSVHVFGAAFSPDGLSLASVGDDTGPMGFTVKVWDRASHREAFSTVPFEGEGVVFCVSYSPDGGHLVAGSQDGRLLVWDAVTGRRIGVIGEHNGVAVFNVIFSPDGRHLASATPDGKVRLWDGTRLNEFQTNRLEIVSVECDITDTLAFSGDSTRLVVAHNDNTAIVWNMDSGVEELSLRSKPAHGFTALAFSLDGEWIASGGTDCKVKLWNARTGELIETFAGHRGEVMRLRFLALPEGPRLISGGRDGLVKFWDLKPYHRTDRNVAQVTKEL